MDVEILLTKHQIELLESTSTITIGIMGRFAGKSYAIGYKIALLLSEGYNVIGMSQTDKTVGEVLIRYTKQALDAMHIHYTENIADRKIIAGKATLFGLAYSTYENIRGFSDIKALVIDEACLCSKQAYEAVLPCIRGQGDPLIYLISTPKGAHNWVAKLTEDPNNNVIYATSYDNPFISKILTDELEKLYSEETVRQELMGEITNFEEVDQAIPTKLINDAYKNVIDEQNWKITFGLDCARFGDDKTVLVVRKGKNILDIDRLTKSDTMDIVNLVEKYERKYGRDNINSIAIDCTGGWGNGAYDLLKLSRSNVIPCNFSSSSPLDYCNNFRTYIYELALQYLQNGGTLGNNIELKDELLSQSYFINGKGKKQLKDKAIIKHKLGRSPDDSDAFCLSLVTKGDMFIKDQRQSEQFKINYKLATSNRIRQATRWVNDRE